MDYFNGLEFVGCGSSPHNRSINERIFPDYYGIQFCHESEVVISVDDSEPRKHTGSWVLITRPGPKFHYGPPAGRENNHNFVCFKGSRVRQYIRTGLLPVTKDVPVYQITRPETFISTLHEIIKLLSPMVSRNHSRAVHLLEGLMLQIHEQPAADNPAPEYLLPKLDDLAAKLNANSEADWDFHHEASLCGISYPHFRRVFFLRHHQPPGRYLNLCRLKKAAELLKKSDEQISEIAEMCGFKDQFYFSRLFKKYYRFSPLNFRREFSENH